jgi:hypothetical protein
VLSKVKTEAWFLLCFTTLYMILAAISYSLWPKEIIPPIYLPFALLFAGVLVYGKRVLPGIVLGTIGTALLGGATLSETLLLSTIDLFYGFIMLFATRWTLGEKRMIDEVIATRNFLLLVIFIALPLYSILGSTILSIFFPEDYGDISLTAFEWWTGDVVAAVFLGSSLTLFLRRIKSGQYLTSDDSGLILKSIPIIGLAATVMLWSAGLLPLPDQGLLLLLIPLYIASIITRAIGLYGLAITTIYWWAQVMIKLEIGPLSLVDGQFWTFAITLGVFGSGWFLMGVLLKNHVLISEKQSEAEVALQKASSAKYSMFDALNQLSLARDNETGNHILRTQHYVRAIALALRDLSVPHASQLDDETIEAMFLAAPLHDVGKVGIPDSILLKPGKLTESEWTTMKTHALVGENVLLSAADQAGSDDLRIAGELAGGHHEKWNGTGYPRKLVGEDIPLSARIMAIADVYDALTSSRVYKSAWSHKDAISEIASLSGAQFDPQIVEAFFAAEPEIVLIAQQFKDQD